MKNITGAFLAAALFLSPGTSALAQTTLALTGGVNLATLAFDGPGGRSDTKFIRRPSIGLAAAIPVWKRLSLHLEGGYSGKGASFREGFLDYRGSLKLDYIELWLMGKAQVFRSGDGAELHLLAGPAWASQTSCRRQARVTIHGETATGQGDCGVSSTSSGDFAMAGGAWLEMWVSDRMGLLLSGRYTLGIHDIDERVDNVTMKNRAWSLHTGALFSIGAR